MTSSPHCEAAELALFAMQLLEKEDHQAIALHGKGCAFCRQELSRLQGDMASFAQTTETVSPPAAMRDRVLHQVAREKKIAPPPPVPPAFAERDALAESIEEPVFRLSTRKNNPLAAASRSNKNQETIGSSRSILGTLFLGLGWAIAAGLVVVGLQLYHQRQDDLARFSIQAEKIDQIRTEAVESRRALDTLTDSSGHQILLSGTSTAQNEPAPLGRVIYVPSKGALIFFVSGLGSLQASSTYELWLIPADGRPPIPSGIFHPDQNGNATVLLPPLPKATEAKAFGVTIESKGGSQSPTLPIVLAGS